jgi:hypothetical protein
MSIWIGKARSSTGPSSVKVECTTEDWSNLEQRMHFILHLFRSYHYELSPLTPPFSAEQVQAIAAGRVPAGDL